MEYVDILDELGRKTGEVLERKIAKKKKCYTLGVHIWISNSENQFLLQKRNHQKHTNPGMWDTTGGGVQAKESSLEAVVREVKEELGIELDSKELKYLFRLPAQENPKPMFLDVYFVKKNINIKKLKLQKEEVEEVCYVSKETMLDWYQTNPQFVKQPYFLKLLESLEEIL